MKNVFKRIQKAMKDERGATMVEYALMVALIAVVCIVTVTALGHAVDGQFSAITTAL